MRRGGDQAGIRPRTTTPTAQAGGSNPRARRTNQRRRRGRDPARTARTAPILDEIASRLDAAEITGADAAEQIAERLFHWNTNQASTEPINFVDCVGREMPPRRDPDGHGESQADAFFAIAVETDGTSPAPRREIVETVRRLHRKQVENRAKATGFDRAASGVVVVEVHRPASGEAATSHRLHLTTCHSTIAKPRGATPPPGA